jgi:hypothetical protein
MACKIINNSGLEISGFEDMIQSLVSFSQDRFGFEKPPTLFLNSDPTNAENMLGKTAYYDPERKEIHIYTTDRHPKDIMRSISHELVHHHQNCKGDFAGDHYSGEGYAQKDPHMRKMEQEAYLQGNMCFRDWEDSYKQKQKVYNEWRTNTMSLKEWKNKELFGLLSEKWGFGKNTINEEAKPDFLDLDKDGDKEESMKDAAEDAKEKDGGEKEEDKDLSKVPPQLRKHVAKKKLDEEEVELQVGTPGGESGATMGDISEEKIEEEQLDEDEVEESVRAMTSANKEHFKNMPEKASKLRESLKERFTRLIK